MGRALQQRQHHGGIAAAAAAAVALVWTWWLTALIWHCCACTTAPELPSSFDAIDAALLSLTLYILRCCLRVVFAAECSAAVCAKWCSCQEVGLLPGRAVAGFLQCPCMHSLEAGVMHAAADSTCNMSLPCIGVRA